MNNPLQDLPLVAAGPSPEAAPAVTLLVHGRGRAPAEMLALAERFALPEMAYLAPTAAGGTWYPESFLAPIAKNEPHLGWALARLEGIVRDLEGRGVTRDRMALVGFSQGACLVAEYVLRHPCRWGGVSLLTGGVIGPAVAPPPGPAGDLHGTPIFLGCCEADAWVPLARVRDTAALFTAMGAVAALRVAPGAEHVVTDGQVTATRALLASLVSSPGGARAGVRVRGDA